MRRQRAAEQRERVAHGFSPASAVGQRLKVLSRGAAKENLFGKRDSIAPSGACGFFLLRFHGLRRGYCLPSLRGWPPGYVFKRRRVRERAQPGKKWASASRTISSRTLNGNQGARKRREFC